MTPVQYVSPRSIFNNSEISSDQPFSSWVKRHLSKIDALVESILKTKPPESRSENRIDGGNVHHHYHQHSNSPWGWGGGPTVINNYGSSRYSKKEEDHTELAIISSAVLCILSFFFGKALATYQKCSKQLAEHKRFYAEFSAAQSNLEVPSHHQGKLDSIRSINDLTFKILDKKQSDALINLVSLASGVAFSILVAYGSYFKHYGARTGGLVGAVTLIAATLFRFGYSYSDDSLKESAKAIRTSLNELA